MDRRRFLRLGLWGGGVLAVGLGGLHLIPTARRHVPTRPLRVLDAREFAIVAAIAARVVDAPDLDPVRVTHSVDDTLALVDPEVQGELRRFIRLVETGAARLVREGRLGPFTRLGPVAQDDSLASFRDSRLLPLRAGYHAVRKACLGAYYADSRSWAAIGYPGPPVIDLPPDYKPE